MEKPQKNYYSIDPLGCRVTELVLGGKKIFWSGVRPDGKAASTHPCLPHFGQVTEGPLAALPQHGPARNEQWERVQSKNHSIHNHEQKYYWEMKTVPGIYPDGLVVYRTVELSKAGTFTLTTAVHNHGDQPLPINPGEHGYFAVPYRLRNEVKVNGERIPDVWPETFYGDLKEVNTLVHPKIGTLELTVHNFKRFAAWSVPEAEFICIEPIWGLPNSVNRSTHVLQPKTKVRFTLSLMVVE